MAAHVDVNLIEVMKAGAYFYKHDYGRAKRGRKWLVLSNDGLSLKWRAVGNTEVVQPGDGSSASSRGGTSSRGSFGSGGGARSLMKSASFSRFSSVPLSDVSHIIFGPYTDTFSKKTARDRVDARWVCFSLVLRESRTLDLAIEEESGLLSWLLGLQQLIVYFSPDKTSASERWTLPKLQLQKLRLKVSGESDRTGQGPFDVVLSAVLDAAQEKQGQSEKATLLQASWKRRSVQGKFQSAVGELMEINGLIEGLSDKERDLEERQNFTALKIEKAMKLAEMEEPPPKMPTDREMADPKKMQAYMLQMGEYSARQQLKLSAMEAEVRENQAVTAQVNQLQAEKRQLQDMSKRLTFSLTNAEQASLSEADAARVLEIQQQLGVTPRGSIKAQNVREVRLYKDQQATRLGIIFHQNTPAELGDVSSDATPRAGGRQPVVLPVIKTLDKAGIAGSCPDLHEGDQVISVNGNAALSNVQTVQMLRDAVGTIVLAVRETAISKTPRGITPVRPDGRPMQMTGLRVVNQPS